MKRNRTKPTVNTAQNSQLRVLATEMIGRMQLSNKMGGVTYNGARDLYQALGYPAFGTLQFQDFYSRYIRQDMAKAVIDRPVNGTWKGRVSVIEAKTKEQTPLESAWEELYVQKGLKKIFPRLDKLTGLGRYSVLFFGLDDVHNVRQYQRKPRKGAKLLYLRPLSELTATIESFESNQTNKRYGLPKFYNIVLSTNADTKVVSGLGESIKVHYSRVLHITEDVLQNEVYGTPRLEAIYNRLIDLDKIVGGDAEMFWRGARPGYTGKVDPEYQMSDTMQKSLEEQIELLEHSLKRIMVNEGVTFEALQQQIADPANHVDVQVQMISADTEIPKRVLTGSESGELSSSQDQTQWNAYVSTRREERVEPNILRPFVDKCIELDILPPAGESKYLIQWDKLFSMSNKEKVDLGKARAISLKFYAGDPVAQQMMPMPVFLEHFLGFDLGQIDAIMALQNEAEILKAVENQLEAGMKTKQLPEGTVAQDAGEKKISKVE